MAEVPWSYPMKPVRITEAAFAGLRAGDYAMEKKYDGWRALLVVNGAPSLWTREKRPLVAPVALMSAMESLGLPTGTVLDGELWSPEKRGGWAKDPDAQCVLTFWDAVRSGGEDLSGRPLEERRAELERLLAGAPPCVRTVDVMEADLARVREIRAEAESHRRAEVSRSGHVHGVVLKRKGSPRRDKAARCAEHPDWLKIVFFT